MHAQHATDEQARLLAWLWLQHNENQPHEQIVEPTPGGCMENNWLPNPEGEQCDDTTSAKERRKWVTTGLVGEDGEPEIVVTDPNPKWAQVSDCNMPVQQGNAACNDTCGDDLECCG